MFPKRILIDTDPGIDDALAFLLAFASPEVSVEGITIVPGNCTAQDASWNARRILDLAQAGPLPVVRGAERPLVQPLVVAAETHGPTGLGYAVLPPTQRAEAPLRAADFLIERILAEPGEISVVALGPLTNLAMALRLEPRLAAAIPELIIMGGAINVGGNTTPLAEFNIWCDPHAAHIVFHAGIPTTLVPLDVTYQCVFTRAHVDRLLAIGSPVAQFIADATRFYMEFHDEYQQVEGCVINDPLALALAFAPGLVETRELFVDVDISGGVSMGKTFADFYRMNKQPANMKVALSVDSQAFLDLFVERMAKLCRRLMVK